MNNDDWVYYRMVGNFLLGDFRLDPISAPTFYTQGFLAFIFSKLFGLVNIPILTIIISLGCVYLLYIILRRFFGLSRLISILLSSFLLFNPLFSYSSIGFMTENYFLFFILLSLFYFHKFEKERNLKDFTIVFFIIFLGFMIRQVMMVFPIAMGIYLLIKKEYKFSIFSFSFFVLLFSFYTFIFPKTAEMYEKPLQFQHFLNFNYSYALLYGSILVIVSLLLSLILSFLVTIPRRNILLFVVISSLLFLSLSKIYKPMTLSWGEFPYLENTWERTGLYPRGILGTKYQLRFNYDLYHYWDLGAKVVVSMFLGSLLVFFHKRKLIDFNIIFIVLYLGLMLLTETFYDRYLLTLFPFVILFLVTHIKFNRFVVFINMGFILFLAFYTYQLTMDFVLVNNYVWNKSNDLVVTKSVLPNDIQGNNAWKLNYRNTSRNYIYDFSYDSTLINDVYKNNYVLVEEKRITYPFNMFISPTICLYQKK